MNTLIRMLIVLATLALTGNAYAAGGITAETDVASFLHQVSLGTDSVRVRQVVSPLRIRLPFAGGHLEAHGGAVYAERTDQSGPTAQSSRSRTWPRVGQGTV